MHTYEARKFAIPQLQGISQKSVEEHLALYEGYVKNFNAISAAISDYAKEFDKNSLAVHELLRRRSFEFGGMRLHEHYFAQFEGGAQPLAEGSAFAERLAKDYRSVEQFQKVIGHLAAMRGPGWVILYYDPQADELLTGFTGEQHQGHLVTLPILLALDVWEHAYLLDYGALGKGKYVEAFFQNLNWGAVDKRFEQLAS